MDKAITKYLFSLFLIVYNSSNLHAQNNPVNAKNICQHIEILASDAFEGRQTATSGEEKTINYIAEQYKAIGLQPAAGDSYFQKVELAKYNIIAPAKIKFHAKEEVQELKFKQDFLLASNYNQEVVRIKEVELVFAGFGIYAPEIGWDDYKDIEVKGKIVVVLSDVPGEYSTDSTLWKGDPAANLYSKSFYKKNEAAKRGAIGLLSIYKQSKQGLYTWESIANYVGKDDLTIKRALSTAQLKFSGVLTQTAIQRVFQWAGKEKYDFQKAALDPDFKPMNLGLKVSFSFSNTWEDITTNNVVGLLPGTDLADEVMIYSAHWDHVGVLSGAEGDNIRNGAVDNASGTAALIEIARAYKKRRQPNRRSILFLATAAEEMGLLGAIWYAANPLFPLGNTVVNFNMDSHYPYGKSTHILGVVYGRSELDQYLDAIAKEQGRTIVPNTAQNIAANIFFRSDHFPFAEVGIPTEFAVGAGEAMGHDNEIYQKKMAAFQYKYHQPSDEYEADFNCEGIAQDAELILKAGWGIDQEGAFPMWDKRQPFAKYRYNARFKSRYFHDVSTNCLPTVVKEHKGAVAKSLDIDDDGDMDLILMSEKREKILLLNDGKGNFVNGQETSSYLKQFEQESGFDPAIEKSSQIVDLDRRLLPASVKGEIRDVEMADYNGDGIVDLYLSNFLGSDFLLFGRAGAAY